MRVIMHVVRIAMYLVLVQLTSFCFVFGQCVLDLEKDVYHILTKTC